MGCVRCSETSSCGTTCASNEAQTPGVWGVYGVLRLALVAPCVHPMRLRHQVCGVCGCSETSSCGTMCASNEAQTPGVWGVYCVLRLALVAPRVHPMRLRHQVCRVCGCSETSSCGTTCASNEAQTPGVWGVYCVLRLALVAPRVHPMRLRHQVCGVCTVF